MNIKEYCDQAKRTKSELNNLSQNNVHMVLGMVTEVGELADVFKKNIAYEKDIDWINVQEEVGDILWYIANFCTINGFDIEKILENNIEKLFARYPEKFSSDYAINRDLNKERSILEKMSKK